MRILFMGTPDFARAALERLYQDGHDICGVFTQPDRPKNRGMRLYPTPVKELALQYGAPVFQPESLRKEEAFTDIKNLAPDLIVVVAYGRILPKAILDLPPNGCINIHGSLLPKYRGAAPIQWTVLNGEPYGGVTAMYMAEALDAGDILATKPIALEPYETAGSLYGRLQVLGAQLLSETVRSIEAGTAVATPQDESQATFAPQLSKDMSPVDFTRPATKVAAQICGLDPWPVATVQWGDVKFKVFAPRLSGRKTGATPGSIVEKGKEGIGVACGDGEILLITELQAPGGRRMPAADYLKGHEIHG